MWRTLFVFVFLLPVQAQQPWSGILDPSRAVDWSHMGAVIPTNRPQCMPTGIPNVVNGVVMPSGQTDITDANDINQALAFCAAPANCPPPPAGSGCYLQLGKGTFTIVGGITFGGSASLRFKTLVNNVTLRGWGPDKTILKAVTFGNECSSGNAICILGNSEYTNNQFYSYGGACSWTAGYGKGTTILTLSGCLGPTNTSPAVIPTAGQQIVLDQRNDDIGMTSCTSSGATATCTVSLSSLPAEFVVGACVAVGGVGGTGTTNTGTGFNQTSWTPIHSPSHCNAITAVSGNTFSYTLIGTAPASVSCATTAPNVTSGTSSCFATVDTGGTLVAGNPCVIADGNCPSLSGGLTNGRYCPDPWYNGTAHPQQPTCIPGEVSFRSQSQVVTVVACSTCASNQIAIDTPIQANNWRAARNPGVWWFAVNPHDIGVEDLTIDCLGDGGGSGQTNFGIAKCHNCWIRNVRSIAGSRNHIWLTLGVSHFTVSDSYFYGTKLGASQSYGIEIYGAASDLLFENNIFVVIVSPIMNGGSFGAVEAYNYAWGDNLTTPNFLSGGISVNHDLNGAELIESNNTPAEGYDNIHGSVVSPNTHFRSRARGGGGPVAKTNGLSAVQVSNWNRGLSVIGSVLGTSQTRYIGNGQGYSNLNNWIFWTGSTSQNFRQIQDDPLVLPSIMRWGNYDTATVTQTGGDGTGIRFCGSGSEPNCGGASEMNTPQKFLPANPVPANHDLPASFYLRGQPSWWQTAWGTPPFPAIGSDIIGGDDPYDPSGHTYRIPAQIVQMNMPFDPAYAEGSRQSITSGSWASGGNFGGTITLTGTFYIALYDTIQIKRASPVGYNGMYQVLTADGPTAAGSVNPAPTQGGAGSGNLPGGTYLVSYTRLNQYGETSKGSAYRLNNISANNSISITSPCVFTGGPAPGGSCAQNGTPAGNPQAATHWNAYLYLIGDSSGKTCKQNTTPIAIGTNYTITTLIQSSTGTCVESPTRSTAASNTITLGQHNDPGGLLVTSPAPTITSPMIQTFNADTYYGSAEH
jgi:hypothetical protein